VATIHTCGPTDGSGVTNGPHQERFAVCSDALIINTLVKFIPYSLNMLAQLINIVDLHIVGYVIIGMTVSNVKIVLN